MERKVGIIGYGGFGAFLERAWSGLQDVNVAAVADPLDVDVPDGVRVYPSAIMLLQEADVDIVSVATPPSTHAAIAVTALERGVHVLVEKPVATTLEDAERIIGARDAASRVATVNFMLRFNPIIACIHEWCRSGVFGSLQRVVVENYAQDESLDPKHWFWDESESGGILVEHGVHFFDIVNGCTSAAVSRVSRRSWSRSRGVVDRVYALVEYEDGLVASHYHAFNRLNDFEQTSLRFVFDAAQLETEGWIPMRGRLLALVGPDNRSDFDRLPNFNITSERAVSATRSVPLASGSSDQKNVDTMITGEFGLTGSKEEAYLNALRALMSDVIEATRNPSHALRVTLEDGIAALRLAVAGNATR